jgi:hypothetical protein
VTDPVRALEGGSPSAARAGPTPAAAGPLAAGMGLQVERSELVQTDDLGSPLDNLARGDRDGPARGCARGEASLCGDP